MPIHFTNYKGDKYFIKTKLTKKGNTTYYLTKKEDDTCLDELPDGFEVVEKYDSKMMVLRKSKEPLFNLKEIHAIKKELEKNEDVVDYRLDVNGDVIKIYTFEAEEDERINGGGLEDLIKMMSPSKQELIVNSLKRFHERMRIYVEKEDDERSFRLQRYCYRGSIDDWINIGGGDDMKELSKTYIVHLGKMSYYELYGF